MAIYIDTLTVLLAAIIGFAFSWLWYSSFLFGKKERHKISWKMCGKYGLYFCIIFVVSYFMAFLQQYLQVTSFWDGLVSGSVFWIAFVLPTHLFVFLQKTYSIRQAFLEQGMWLILFLLVGGILAG